MPWQSIETFGAVDPIWVIKYTMFQRIENGFMQFCEENDEGAIPFVSCHGYYTNEADARKVLNHFPKPNTYRIERVYKRVLKGN